MEPRPLFPCGRVTFKKRGGESGGVGGGEGAEGDNKML